MIGPSKLFIAWAGGFAILACVHFTAVPSAQGADRGMLIADEVEEGAWVGRRVMPKMDARFRVGSKVMNWTELEFPVTVEQTQGEWLWVGNAWVLASSVIPVEESFNYYTEHLLRNPGDSDARKLRLLGLAATQAIESSTDASQPEFNGQAAGGVKLIAEKFVPDSRPPNYPIELRGLPNYRFKVTGSPQDMNYRLWLKSLGKAPELLGGHAEYLVNDQDYLILRAGDTEGDVQFEMGIDFARGEPIEFCLISLDGRIRAFEEIIPFPLETSNDVGYHVSLKLTEDGDYTIVATGFEPNQEVTFVATDGAFVDIHQQRFDARKGMGMDTSGAEKGQTIFLVAGWLRPKFRLGGSAQITVTGKGGAASIDFDWGSSVKAPRSHAIQLLHRAASSYHGKDYDAALSELDKAIEVDPTYLQGYLIRAMIQQDFKHNYACAIEDLTKAITIDPTEPSVFYGRGVLQAFYPDPAFRDGPQAVSDLTRACELTNWGEAQYVADLGAAYAEAGHFQKAIEWQTKAIEMEPDNRELAENGAARLKLYHQGKPFRLSSAPSRQ